MNASVLPYMVIYTTSEDESHSVRHIQDDTVNGWHSSKTCTYPQEIVFKFKSQVYIETVKLISHESKIARRVSIYTSNNESVNNKPAFQKIGHIKFSDNSSTQFNARELKVVHINMHMFYFKLVFKDCYKNQLNTYDQVGLISAQFIGKVTENKQTLPHLSHTEKLEHSNRLQYVSQSTPLRLPNIHSKMKERKAYTEMIKSLEYEKKCAVQKKTMI